MAVTPKRIEPDHRVDVGLAPGSVSLNIEPSEARFADEQEGRLAVIEAAKPFTAKQGQYLAFIYYYTKIHGTPPAEADFQRFFRVTPPVVHQMIKTLQARGFIDAPVDGQGTYDETSRLRAGLEVPDWLGIHQS